MPRLPLLCFVVATVAAAGAGGQARSPGGGSSEHPEALPIQRFRSDDRAFATYSGLDDSLTAVIRDAEAWRSYWGALHRGMLPQPPVPAVDFEREAVVLAALGSRPSGGHEILVEGAVEERNEVVVVLRRTFPAPGCPVTAAFTQPADVVRIPLRQKPVRFAHRHHRIEC